VLDCAERESKARGAVVFILVGLVGNVFLVIVVVFAAPVVQDNARRWSDRGNVVFVLVVFDGSEAVEAEDQTAGMKDEDQGEGSEEDAGNDRAKAGRFMAEDGCRDVQEEVADDSAEAGR
jgi:hypothetical protein